MTRRAAAFIVTAALALTSSACSSDKEPSKGEPDLQQAWEVTHDWDLKDGVGHAPELDRTLLWSTDEAIVFGPATRSHREFTAFDRTSGEESWTLEIPAGQRLCSVTKSASPAGTAGLVLGDGRGCATAAALDVATGELTWKSDLSRGPDGEFENRAGVAVTDSTLSVTDACQVQRFAVDSGGKLEPVIPAAIRSYGDPGPWEMDKAEDNDCYKDISIGVEGNQVAILSTANGNCSDHATLEVFDADSGKRRSAAPVPQCTQAVEGDPIQLGAIVSAEPLLVEFAHWGGDATLHQVDGDEIGPAGPVRNCGPSCIVGFQDEGNPGTDLVVMTDHPVSHTVIHGYDPSRGTTEWARPLTDGEKVAGLRSDGLFTVEEHTSDFFDVALRCSSLEDGIRRPTLGMLPHFDERVLELDPGSDSRTMQIAEYNLVDDLLLVTTGSKMHALRVPGACRQA